MGGRGTFAFGNQVPFAYEQVNEIAGVKVLVGKAGTGLHGLPEESHSSKCYMKLHRDGTLNMLRVYGDDHFLKLEIAYHPEPKLTGNHEPVLHIHYYDHDFNRTGAEFLDRNTYDNYKECLIGRKWYDWR